MGIHSQNRVPVLRPRRTPKADVSGYKKPKVLGGDGRCHRPRWAPSRKGLPEGVPKGNTNLLLAGDALREGWSMDRPSQRESELKSS